MKHFVFILIVQLLVVDFEALSQNKNEFPNTDTLDNQIQTLMYEADIPGLSVAIIRNGKLTYVKGYGVSNTETNDPVNNNSVFEAASLGKPLFAYLVLKLTDKGILDLDTPLSQYVDTGFTKENKDILGRITARMVLSHTTGLPNEKDRNTPLELAFNPGQQFSYSGEGIQLLQKVIENITQTGLEQLMKQYVFAPLKMENTSFIWQESYDSLKVYPHNELMEVTGRGKPLEAYAANSLHTTANDYAKFLVAVIKGEGLKSKTYKEMIKTQVMVDSTCAICLSSTKANNLSPNLVWGLGWGIEKNKNGDWLSHWGDNVTYKGFATANLKSKDAIVFFGNSVNSLSITEELVKSTLGQATNTMKWVGYVPYNTPIKRQLKKIIAQEGDAIRALQKSDNEFTSVQLNWLGQQLSNRKLYEEAIAVFTINVAKDSTSFQAHLGLGEAYLKNKQRALATKHLKEALALAPSNKKLERKVKILKKPEVIVTPELATAYIGKYKSAIGVLSITKEGDALYVQLEGNPKEELLPDTKDIFVSADAGVQLQFMHKNNGSTEIEIMAGGQKFIASRME